MKWRYKHLCLIILRFLHGIGHEGVRARLSLRKVHILGRIRLRRLKGAVRPEAATEHLSRSSLYFHATGAACGSSL